MIRSAEAVLDTRLVRGKTGGRRGGNTTLTERGKRLARKPVDQGPPRLTRWACYLVGAPMPRTPVVVAVPDAGVEALVASAPSDGRSKGRNFVPGDEFELEIPAWAVTLEERGRSQARTSARNRWTARVIRIGAARRWGVRQIDLQVGALPLVVAVTGSAVRDLGLKRGSVVLAQVKATALRLRRPQVPVSSDRFHGGQRRNASEQFAAMIAKRDT
jgi:molybdopterin-binding protein